MQFHGYSLKELDDMYPFERELYVSMLNRYIEEENDRIKNKNGI